MGKIKKARKLLSSALAPSGTSLLALLLIFSSPLTSVLASDTTIAPSGNAFDTVNIQDTANSVTVEKISAEVEQFLLQLFSHETQHQQRVDVSIGYLDPRIRLPNCDQPLSLSRNGGNRSDLLRGGRVNVKVSCPGLQAWSRFIPAEVSVYRQVPVLNQALGRGEIIKQSHMQMMEWQVSSLRRPPLTETKEALGKELKRSLPAFEPISPDHLTEAVLIQRGEQVQIIASQGGIQIRQLGEALEDASNGGTLNVRNNSSKQVVQATAIEAGKVIIKL